MRNLVYRSPDHRAQFALDCIAPGEGERNGWVAVRARRPTCIQYARLPNNYSDASCPGAPGQCLEAVTKKRDPDWDIALHNGRWQPVIDLSGQPSGGIG